MLRFPPTGAAVLLATRRAHCKCAARRLSRGEPALYNAGVSEAASETSRPGAESDVDATAGGRRLGVAWVAAASTLERAERQLKPLVVGLLDELHRPTVICPEGAEGGDLPSPPVEFVTYPRRRWLGIGRRAAEAVCEELRRRKIGLLHGLAGETADLTRLLARTGGFEYVLAAHRLGDARRIGSAGGDAFALMAGSEPVRRDLLDHHAAPAGKIPLARLGVYQVRRPTCFADPQRSIAIVVGGERSEYAPVAAVLEGLAEINARNYDCAFFLLGGGPDERRLRKLADRLDLRNRLTFAPHQKPTQLAGILKGADVYISPAASREIDVEALLAMAAGVPVLSAGAGASDFLVDGRTTLMYKQGEPPDLTVKLAALLDDRAATRALAENALAYLREHHSPAGMVATLADVYREALGVPRRE